MPAFTERLLTVAQAAELLATGERFPRRLIAERRIRFVRVGRHPRLHLGPPFGRERSIRQRGEVGELALVRRRRWFHENPLCTRTPARPLLFQPQGKWAENDEGPAQRPGPRG